MIKCKINNVEHSITDGFIYKDKYTEELDSAMITIPFSDKLNLSPFDFVELEDERFGKITMLVDTWVEDIVSFYPLKYNYNINLISETIKLQKIVMPNLAITQPIGAEKTKIYDKINDYYTLYINPQYPELSISSSLRGLTLEEICPENLFNRPTAFEVYNTLLSKVNSIVKIKNNVIDYVRLDKYNSPIDVNKLYYVNDSQNMQEYANRLDIQVNNGVSNRDNFSTIGGITVRGGDGDSVLNDDNMSILLDKPIYDFDTIAGVYVYFRYNYKGQETGKSIANITDYIVEKSVYDTYLTSNSAGRLDNDEDAGKYYKRNALYYVRGSNRIEGLNYSEKQIVGNSWIALYNILTNVTYKTDPNLVPDFDESDIKDNVFFKVEYKTTESYRINVEKDNTYNATLIDNQSETQVDAENFGKVEQDKLNRLGNKTKIITATYSIDEKIPELGDYIGEYVLAEREIVYYDDYTLFKGYLYKNFVRKNMFYGLNSKKRSTQIDVENVVRNDIVNYDLSFELERQKESPYYDDLKRYILYPLMMSDNVSAITNQYDYNEFPKYSFITTKNSSDENLIVDDGRICLTPSTYASGKSNIIHFQFKDNFSAGIRVTDKVTGGKKQEYVKYVDDYGNFHSMNVTLYSNKRKDFARIEEGAKILETIKPIADNLPLLTYSQANYISQNSNYLFNFDVDVRKDNRETTAISINLNYKDSNNVIIGSFAENTGIAYHYIVRAGVYICYSTEYEYEKGDEYGIGTNIIDGSAAINYDNANIWLQKQENNISYPAETKFDFLELYLNNVDTSNWKSWGIVEASTNRLILGVNKGNEDVIPTKIYLNCKKKNY